MRVIFMGTPDFAVPALLALVAAGHEVIATYTQPPRPGGRSLCPGNDDPGAGFHLPSCK